MAHDRYVELERHPLGGFGFSIIGGVDTHLPPMVCAIVHQGSAQLNGKVFAGDVILEVNGQPVTQLTTNQVVEIIRNTQDNLRLRLRDDPGTRDRARPYLRPFAVADPKLAIYQARLKRSASAPNQPRHRAHTDQLPRKGIKRAETKIMQKSTSTSSDDMRAVERLSLLGLEEGADGIFIRRQDDVVERLITDFPVESSAYTTRSDTIARPESYKRPSYPSDENITSKEAIPGYCTNCGELVDVYSDGSSSPGVESSSSPSSQQSKCKRCGRSRKYSAGGSSLPETPYAVHRTLQSSPSPVKNSSQTPTKINGNLNYLPHQKHSDGESSHLETKSPSVTSDLKTLLNGGVKTEHIVQDSSQESSTDTLHRYKDLQYESPSSLAKRLYNLDGFSQEDVTKEISKNTTYGKSVAMEFLKYFDFSNESITVSLGKFLKAFHLAGETQERERIFIPFSKRYHHCNEPISHSEDATHTLVCAALLLNSDLHGETLSKKMTQAQFVENLAGLCDGKDYPKDVLKTIYQEIKAKPLEGFGYNTKDKMPTPTPQKRATTPNGFKGSSGKPFVEIQASEDDKVFKEGLLYRKVTMGSEGKKTSAWKRKWVPFYGTLKGMVLFLHKSDDVGNTEQTRNCLGVHHSLATRATDYIKKPYVLKFVTSDWREFLFQARGRGDMNEWIEAINLVAATYSSPPLPPPIGSCKKFQRPVLPFSRTQLSLTKQVEHHEKKSAEAEEELIDCLNNKPKDGSVREQQEWQEKHEFLEYEYKRYKTYVNVLRGSKLQSKPRDKPRGTGSPVSCVW